MSKPTKHERTKFVISPGGAERRETSLSGRWRVIERAYEIEIKPPGCDTGITIKPDVLALLIEACQEVLKEFEEEE